MRYTVKADPNWTPQRRYDEAMFATQFYLGTDFDRLVETCRKNGKIPEKAFLFQLAFFVGIEGYAAEALYEHIWPYG